MASYGDSETESDDEEDVDFENLDSVSIVAARASSSSSSTCSNGSNPGQLIRGWFVYLQFCLQFVSCLFTFLFLVL